VSDYSEVLDCNNYEPRPLSLLRLRRDLIRTPAGTVVRLSAADHAACTRVVVRDAKPGRTYRIRLEYRRISGNRPQICIVQTGADGCELAAKPTLANDWTPYERILTVGESATGLQVILHADASGRLQPPTVTEYRGLRVEALDEVGRRTVFPPAVPPVSVSLAAGPHELRVDGGLAGSVLAPFEPLADCFRTDDRTPAEAGLVAQTQVGADGRTTYALGAVGHVACIAATAPDFGASSMYELSLEARRVALRNPKFCVFSRGPDRCMSLPSVSRWDGWTPYEALLAPDPAAVETRMYLYGMRDLKERQQAQVEYRDVRLRPVASPTTVVLARQAPATAAAEIRWDRQNPATFTADVTSPGPTVLALAEGAAPGWAISGDAADGARKVTLQGWMTGWHLPAGGSATLAYAPARYSRLALYLLPVSALAGLGWIWLGVAVDQPGRLVWRRFRDRLRGLRRFRRRRPT